MRRARNGSNGATKFSTMSRDSTPLSHAKTSGARWFVPSIRPHVDPALNTRAYSWLRLRLRWLDEDQRATKRWAAAFHHARAPAMSDYKQCSTTPATRLRL